MKHTLIPLDDPDAWSRALRIVRHPHAHTHAHVSAFHATAHDDTFLYVHLDDLGETLVACPVSIRGDEGERDLYTPYGFGGFAANGPVPTFADEWRSFAESEDWVASYIFQNPLLDGALGFEEGSFARVGTTYVLDLSQSPDDLLARMSSRRRAELRRWSPTAADLTSDPDEVDSFLAATADAFFDARAAAPVYRLTNDTWSRLLRAPSVWCTAVREHGTVVAASIFGESCGLVDYLFGISAPGASKYSAPLIWEAVNHFGAAQATTLNLGGGITAGDGVAEFKRRFGPDELPLTSGRFIHRVDTFRDLCRRAGADEDSSGFFPPYRRKRS